MEIIENIKTKCGPQYPVGIRIIGDEWLPDGFHLEEAIMFSQGLEQAGVVYISVTGGTYESFPLDGGYLSICAPKGKSIPYGEEIKKHVNVPVFINGKIADPVWMNELLEEGKGDVIALGRPLISDPDLPIKAQKGALDDIRICNSCSHCLDNFMHDLPIECFQNPEVGRETEYAIKKAETPRKVLVVGGGPGGLEAARVAALRGHAVTLMEQGKELGGQLLLAAVPVGKEEYRTVTVDWLAGQCKKAGVKIELKKKVDSGVIDQFKPDVLLIATGAKPMVPPIPGIDGDNVITYAEALTYEGDLNGKNIVVVGGADIGAETGEYLATKGANVSVVELLPELAPLKEMQSRICMLTRMCQLGLVMKPQCHVDEIKKDAVVALDLKTLRKETIPADLVVLALGSVPNNELAATVGDKADEVHFIGDCVVAGKAVHAIHQGAFIARQI